MSDLRLTRTVKLPDDLRVARCLRAPELGPRICFFSGGSALRKLSRRLKHYTHNSIHLITPFDSGGSSAVLREAFDMLAVGDLRNRLMSLADETSRGNPEIYELFSHRFAKGSSPEALRARLDSMVLGGDLVAQVPSPMRRIVRTYLRIFADRMPDGFDLRGASIGNLILCGGYLNNDGDIDSVVFLFSKLVAVLGTVLPTVDSALHLKAHLADGSEILGQHRFTGKEVAPVGQRITGIGLVSSLEHPEPAATRVHDKVAHLIEQADLIVFPFGSFWSSVVCNLLPAGVGSQLVAAGCPKIYVPSTGSDPELVETSLSAAVAHLLGHVRSDAGADVPTDRILNAVLVDTARGDYRMELDIDAVRAMGIPVVDTSIARPGGGHDAQRLTEVLLSLC